MALAGKSPQTGKSRDEPDPRRRSRRLRWAVVLVLVALVHLTVLLGVIRMPGPLIPIEMPHAPQLEAILLPPPPPPRPPAPPRPKPVPPKPKPAPPAPEPSPEPPAPPLATSPNGQGEVNVGTGGAGTGAGPAAPAAPEGPPAPPVEVVRYAPPPPATMHYNSYVNGVQNPDSLIRWEQDGRGYKLYVETRILWFRFSFQSTGSLGPQGLVPDRYEEHRKKKVETASFDRNANIISFSRGMQVPLPPGAQDRFSVFLQMVSLARGNPQRYNTPGVTESFEVTDTSGIDSMQVQYVGEEQVDTGKGPVRAKHFVRLQRRANDRRKVEVWLAPSLGWMPARLRQTEPDGTQIDLVYRDAG